MKILIIWVQGCTPIHEANSVGLKLNMLEKWGPNPAQTMQYATLPTNSLTLKITIF